MDSQLLLGHGYESDVEGEEALRQINAAYDAPCANSNTALRTSDLVTVRLSGSSPSSALSAAAAPPPHAQMPSRVASATSGSPTAIVPAPAATIEDRVPGAVAPQPATPCVTRSAGGFPATAASGDEPAAVTTTTGCVSAAARPPPEPAHVASSVGGFPAPVVPSHAPALVTSALPSAAPRPPSGPTPMASAAGGVFAGVAPAFVPTASTSHVATPDLAPSTASNGAAGATVHGVPTAATQSRGQKRRTEDGPPQASPAPKRLRCRTKKSSAAFPAPSTSAPQPPKADESHIPPEMCEELELAPEDPGAKGQACPVTFPHTEKPGLVAPETFTRREILEKTLDSFAHPSHRGFGGAQTRGRVCAVDKLAIGREPNSKSGSDGKTHTHDHVAVLSTESGGFRFMPIKRSLLERHKLASHWSRHRGYHSAVRYFVMPSEKKPQASLDPSPACWAKDGQHPPLFDAAQEPASAAGFRARREAKAKAASQEGKSEPRASELDLYAVVVENKFRNTADDYHADKRLVAYLRQHGSHQLFQLAWKLRHKLNALINDVWAWETVDDTLLRMGGTRVERLCTASGLPCVCGGQWPYWAATALNLNGINANYFWHTFYMSLHDGRREDKAVMTLVGRRRGEGKSFLFSPLKAVFGLDSVQLKPEKGSFPLLDLQTKRVAVLDEWRFDSTVLSLATQLLWFEGKPLVLSQPQNQGAAGHLIYAGTAPIFITTKEQYLDGLVKEARAAEAQDGVCEASMLLRRLVLVYFAAKLPIPAGVKVPDCAACFAQTVLRHAGAHHAAAGA